MYTATSRRPKGHRGEPVSDELITIPDQTLTPRDIIRLFQQGRSQEMPQFKPQFHHPDMGYIPALDKMDKLEYEDYKRSVQARYSKLKEQHDAQIKDLEQEKNFLDQFKRDRERKELLEVQKQFVSSQQTPSKTD